MTRIELAHPITMGDERIEAIELDRPKVKHLMAYDRAEGEMAKMAALIAELAGLPRPVVDQMDAADFMRASEVVSGFLDAGPATGT